MRLNSKQIAQSTGGSFIVEPIDAARLACGITWDSRTVDDGSLYVALPGERVDGHDFIAAALQAGAIVILVTDKPDDATCLLAKEMGAAIIEVSNTASAITDLAQTWRSHLKAQVVGVTGSVGKTTTKNMIRDVIASTYKVSATEGNQNNELGVPKTILSANPEADYVVVEMGMRGMGQIAELCDFVEPDMGVITNIGESHIELLGTMDAIATAKGELFEALPDHRGCAFVNKADPYADALVERGRLEARSVEVVTFDGSGTEAAAEADVYVTDLALDEQGRPHFTLHAPDGEASCSLNLRGMHVVHDACAAAAVGWHAGIGIDAIACALMSSEPEVGRQQVIETANGYTVIDDAYNAGPDSMRASLAMFASMKTQGKKYAVLGDMGELGDYAQACHEGIGDMAASLSLDRLICIGDLSQHIARSAVRAGMPAEAVMHTASIPAAISELEGCLDAGDAVLVKASHFMGLERVVGGLTS